MKKFYTNDVYDVISSPNNTLAVEYIKALDDIGSGIEPVTVRREGAAHDSDSEQEKFLSASAIRKKILAGEDYSAYAPLIDSPAADIRRLRPRYSRSLRMMRPEVFEAVYDAAQGQLANGSSRLDAAGRGASTSCTSSPKRSATPSRGYAGRCCARSSAWTKKCSMSRTDISAFSA